MTGRIVVGQLTKGGDEMQDIDANGSWGNAVSIFEAQRPDMTRPPAGILTGRGTCAVCGADDVNLFRTTTSTVPDACTACRGPVKLSGAPRVRC